MEWQPIEAYDKMEKKPKRAAFFFIGTPPLRGSKGLYSLAPTIQTSRHMGHRECTHWLPLPDTAELEKRPWEGKQ